MTALDRPLFLLSIAWLPGAALFAQGPGAGGGEVRETYAKLCAGYHGADARGSQQGAAIPWLAVDHRIGGVCRDHTPPTLVWPGLAAEREFCRVWLRDKSVLRK